MPSNSSADLLSEALLAIYFHTEHDEQIIREAPEDLRPMDIYEAIDTIAKYSEAGSFKRLRCLARLLIISSLDDGGITGKPIEHAFERFDIPREEFEKFFFNYPSGLEVIEFTYILLFKIVADYWNITYALDCAPELISNDVGFDSITGSTLAHYKGKVTRPFASARVDMDPQNWDKCPGVFKKTYIAEPNVHGEYPVDANHDAFPNPTPSAPGSAWKDVLFEFFEMKWGLYNVWFKNLLNINTSLHDDEFSYFYDLHTAIRSRVGIDERDGGLNRDEGYFRLLIDPEDNTRLIVEGFKLIRMSDRGMFNYYLNAWTAVFLRFIGDEGMEAACGCEN